MRCPRCGGDMSSGVCEECGFPVCRKVRKLEYKSKKRINRVFICEK